MAGSTGMLERVPGGSSEGRLRGGPIPRLRRGPASTQLRPEAREASERPASGGQPVGVVQPPDPAAAGWPLWAYLPVSLVATASVLLAPALLVRAALQPAGVLAEGACALLAAVLSVAIGRLEASAWQRRRGAAGLLFGELMLWGLGRRWWVERRLAR
ncbi:MAG: hypothetical protein ACYDC2_07030, partial [Solirubrobacteraceae bacterium]